MSTQRKRRQFDPAQLDTLRYFDAQATKHYAPIAPRTFYAAIAEGRLRASRIGGNGKLIVKREDLERFLSAAPVESKLDQIVKNVMCEVSE